MSEINATTQQASVVEPTSNDDLLGGAQESAETQTDSVESNPETSTEEVEAEAQSADTTDGETVETEQETDELPDEQLKEFPVEVVAKYAKRYGYTEEEVRNDPRIQRILKDKINADIYAKQLREQQPDEEAEAEDEPTVETPPEPTQEEKARQIQQRMSFIEKFVDEVNDPEVAVQFNNELIKAYEIKDPKAQGLAATKVYTKYMMNFLDTVMPKILPHYLQNSLDGVYPEFSAMHREGLYARAWDEVRKSDAKYASLPGYGPQDGEFGKLMQRAVAQIPNLESIKFVGKDGKPLSPKQQALETYKLVAKIATGQQVSPALVQKAATTAVKKKAEADQKRSLGKSLGAGQSKNSFGNASGGDDLDAEIAKFRKDSTPFGGGK